MPRRALFLLILIAVSAMPAGAVTYLVPPDVEMLQRSDDVVIARALGSRVERTGSGALVTRYALLVEQVLKGPRAAGAELELTERGGTLEGRTTLIPGTPRYVPGERYLVFTDANPAGEPVTFGMGLGQFRLVAAEGRVLALRDEVDGLDSNLEPWRERARDATGFAQYLREVQMPATEAHADYFVDAPAVAPAVSADEFTRGSYLLFEDGMPFRWSTPSASLVRASTAPGGLDGDAAIALAFAQWNGTDSDIDYRSGGRDDEATGGFVREDGRNTILLRDPNHEVGAGVLGIGGITVGADPYTLDGESFWDMVEVDVVISNVPMAAQSCLNTVVVHEVGHTLGFRHSNQPRAGGDATSNAIMNAAVACPWDGVLKAWDKTAANRVYGAPPVCVGPSIREQPPSKTIKGGTTLNLSVEAEGTATLRYQWYEGAARDMSAPVGLNRSTLRVPLMPRSTSYWVRVTNDCGRVDSEVANITVTPSRRRAVR